MNRKLLFYNQEGYSLIIKKMIFCTINQINLNKRLIKKNIQIPNY